MWYLAVGLLHIFIIDVVTCYRTGSHEDYRTGFELII